VGRGRLLRKSKKADCQSAGRLTDLCPTRKENYERYCGRGRRTEEMLNPGARSQALFNITWRGADHRIRHIVLPKELTGVEANIVVLIGGISLRGSHKVGPAYATLMEGELSGEIQPGENTVIGPLHG